MPDDLRNRLGRLADRAPDETTTAAFDRLDRARHRRNRTRKAGALVVALLVAVGGTITVLAAFDDDGGSRVAGDPSPTGAPWMPPEVLTVWPENPARGGDPQEVQAAVDAGDEELAWRLDPRSVAERFGSTVLGWSEMTVIEPDIEIDPGLGVLVFDIDPCPPDATCDLAQPMPTMWLVQPATEGDGGIWSVASVTTPALDLDGLDPADPGLFAGAELPVRLDIPEDRSAHIGVIATNGCDDVTAFETGLDVGRASLGLPPVSPSSGCGETAFGYAFAYVQDDTTVPVGDPLLEAAAIEWPYITLVPVRVRLVVPAPSEPSVGNEPPPRQEATVACGDDTVSVIDGVEVIAQTDGVHVTVENASTHAAIVSFDRANERLELEPGTHDLVVASPPGLETVRCNVPDAGLRGSVNVEVIDAHGLWTPVEPDCEGGVMFSQISDYAEPPVGIADPLDAGKDALERYRRPGDTITFGGYVDAAEHREVVLIRDLRVVVVAHLERGSDGWFAPSLDGCDGA